MEEHKTAVSRRRWLGLISGPFLFALCLALPRPADLSPAAFNTLAVTILMAWWWITEAIPIPVTALLPLVLFPLMHVSNPRAVASAYADANIFLFMGGFFVAMAMEKWGLHQRIALRIIQLVGTSPRRVLLGFMVATAFLSMWISNTATTLMMLPIGIAIIRHVEIFAQEGRGEDDPNFKTALMLGIAFAASIGGIGTLIGTPPNIVFVASLKKLFPQAPEIGFVQWLSMGLPLVAIMLPIAWAYLAFVGTPIRLRAIPGGSDLIRQRLDELGPMSGGERGTLIVFLLMAFAWIWRGDINLGGFVIPGWSTLLGLKGYVHDSTVAMAAAILLFLIPGDRKRGEFLLDWETAVKIPWGILLLFGGGIALAQGFSGTGLAQWIGHHLTRLGDVPIWVTILATATLLVLLTEVTSNTAITTIFMPILAATAIGSHENPLLLMVTGTVAASLAFMLPVATPPNAIVFGSGYVTLPQMAKVGFVLDVIGVIVLLILMYTLGLHVFGIHPGVMPGWAN
ncbi:MAG TPA: SLC13/DASS family transporter [Bacteroidetes bacterium]|nr:SLC13/DASS family transporter [Bacteroidota bacterium]